ncbi:formyltransferase family protein [Flavobacteriaceae bacterium]|nr:formyltransferase family protein [Flavobacteriaceae bacterium]
MRILIITQNEPFYLSNNLNYLFSNLSTNHKIVGCVVADASPFGKQESFITKVFNTKKIFGLNFFMYYSVKFIISKLFKKSVQRVLRDFNIPLIKTQGSINSNKNLDLINSYKPDLLVSILGNQIFKKPLIELANKGCINLHTALLPKYRGLMPSFWVLKNNEKYTGVSVFYVDEGIDSGPIIVQKKVEIGNRTQEELINLTKKIGMDCILIAIDLINNNNVKLIENNSKDKTYFSFPTNDDVREFKLLGKRFF